MLAENLRVGGAVVFWQCAKNTSRADVVEGLRSLSLSNYAPEPRTPMGCLRAALDDAYPAPSKETRHVIRPIPSGFAVVAENPEEEHKGGDAWGETVAVATMSEGGEITLEPYDYHKLDKIKSSMSGAAQWLPAASTGKALVKLIESHGGVCVRPAGGVYWLNDDMLDRWEKVCQVFEHASSRADGDKEAKPNQVNVLRVVADEQMIRSVGEALVNEIEAELVRIEVELTEELSEKACENRLKKTGTLLEKVRRYEKAFGKPLTTLTEGVNRTACLVAMATLQASAAAAGPQRSLSFCS